MRVRPGGRHHVTVADHLADPPRPHGIPPTGEGTGRGPNCTTQPSLSNSKLSGTPARLLTWSCTDGCNAIGITALHAHLGYFMIVASRTTSSLAPPDRTAFSGARASFRFLSK